MNPIFNAFNGQNIQKTPTPAVPEGMTNLYKAFTSSRNPYQLMEGMAQTNPQIAQILPMLRSKSPEQMAREICRQRGINADDFIKQFK